MRWPTAPGSTKRYPQKRNGNLLRVGLMLTHTLGARRRHPVAVMLSVAWSTAIETLSCARGGQWKPPCSATDGNNTQGVCDLIGNVREWTLDGYRFEVYTSQIAEGLPLNDPFVPFEEGMAGTLRGAFGAAYVRERTQSEFEYRVSLCRGDALSFDYGVELVAHVTIELDVFMFDRIAVDPSFGGAIQ